jgi:hypothetical protein
LAAGLAAIGLDLPLPHQSLIAYSLTRARSRSSSSTDHLRSSIGATGASEPGLITRLDHPVDFERGLRRRKVEGGFEDVRGPEIAATRDQDEIGVEMGKFGLGWRYRHRGQPQSRNGKQRQKGPPGSVIPRAICGGTRAVDSSDYAICMMPITMRACWRK